MWRRFLAVGLISACGGGKGATVDAATDGGGVLDVAIDSTADGAVGGVLPCAGTIGLPGLPVLRPGDSVSNMVVGDATADGRPDIVIASGVVLQIAVGRGDGTYAPFTTLAYDTQQGGYQAVAIGDATGDGVPDIAYSMFAGNTSIYTLPNTGTWALETPVPYDMGINPAAVRVVDLNGDAKPDLFAFETQNSTIAVRIAGTAGFGNIVSSSTGAGGSVHVALGDLNGDGRPDAVITSAASASPGVWIAMNNGNGTFAAATLHATAYPTSGVAIGDIDNDGDNDVIVTAFNAAGISAFLNQGAGSFAAAQSSPTGTTLVTGIPALGDVDGDTKLDVVIADAAGSHLMLLPGLGNGLFDTPLNYPGDSHPSSAALVDTNGDGKLDLVVPHGYTIDNWLNNGTATHFEMRSAFPYATSTSGRTARFLDVNADGKADLVTAYLRGATLTGGIDVRVQQANGQFGAATTAALDGIPSSSMKADVDHDGHPDLIVFVGGSSSGNFAQVVLAHGTGTLDILPAFAVPMIPTRNVTGDFDEDGKLDLLLGGTPGVFLYRGNGDGTFSAGTLVWDGTGKTLSGVTAGDVDEDGHADLLVESFTSVDFGLDVMLGTGTGSFGGATFKTVYDLGRLALRDLNNDGHLDLIDYTGNNGVGVQLGSGTGTFGDRTNFAAASYGEAGFGDLNGDGNTDIVIESGSFGRFVSVMLGKGDGTLAAPISYDAGTGLRSLDLVDADGDGHLDVAVDNMDSSSVLFGRCLP